MISTWGSLFITFFWYEATPYVYVLPNFLPRYARREAIHHLKKIWKISSIRTLQSTVQDPAQVGADLARR